MQQITERASSRRRPTGFGQMHQIDGELFDLWVWVVAFPALLITGQKICSLFELILQQHHIRTSLFNPALSYWEGEPRGCAHRHPRRPAPRPSYHPPLSSWLRRQSHGCARLRQ